jgi:hypothetical protein
MLATTERFAQITGKSIVETVRAPGDQELSF